MSHRMKSYLSKMKLLITIFLYLLGINVHSVYANQTLNICNDFVFYIHNASNDAIHGTYQLPLGGGASATMGSDFKVPAGVTQNMGVAVNDGRQNTKVRIEIYNKENHLIYQGAIIKDLASNHDYDHRFIFKYQGDWHFIEPVGEIWLNPPSFGSIKIENNFAGYCGRDISLAEQGKMKKGKFTLKVN